MNYSVRLLFSKSINFIRNRHYSVLAFLIFTILQTITIIAVMIANMIYNSLDEEPSVAVYFLSVIAILAMLCMCYFAVDAIVNENKMMIYSYILISLFLMGRLLYGLAFGGEAEELLTLVPSLLICFFEGRSLLLRVYPQLTHYYKFVKLFYQCQL